MRSQEQLFSQHDVSIKFFCIACLRWSNYHLATIFWLVKIKFMRWKKKMQKHWMKKTRIMQKSRGTQLWIRSSVETKQRANEKKTCRVTWVRFLSPQHLSIWDIALCEKAFFSPLVVRIVYLFSLLRFTPHTHEHMGSTKRKTLISKFISICIIAFNN